jgi:hypothetical protein
MASWLREFGEHGEHGEHGGVVVLGRHRKPEAVMLAYERYERLMSLVDNLVIRSEVEQRLTEDTGERIEFEDVARSLGFDPAEFGRG